MTETLEASVELLERALGYTRVALADVSPDLLDRPTPCAGWSLDALLTHMDDALDAFTEAAAGVVDVNPARGSAGRVGRLQDKACALLGAWSRAAQTGPSRIDVGGSGLASPVLVATAALEITVHGWDVAQSTGRRTPIPSDLAARLLTVAHRVVGPGDRGSRFAPPRPAAAGVSPDLRLLAFLGRDPSGPVGGYRRKPGTSPDLAS